MVSYNSGLACPHLLPDARRIWHQVDDNVTDIMYIPRCSRHETSVMDEETIIDRSVAFV